MTCITVSLGACAGPASARNKPCGSSKSLAPSQAGEALSLVGVEAFEEAGRKLAVGQGTAAAASRSGEERQRLPRTSASKLLRRRCCLLCSA